MNKWLIIYGRQQCHLYISFLFSSRLTISATYKTFIKCYIESLCLYYVSSTLSTSSWFVINVKIMITQEDSSSEGTYELGFRKQPRARALSLARKESIRVGSESLHSRRPFWARRRASDTDEGEREREREKGGWEVAQGDRENDGHLRSVPRSLVHSLTHSPLSRFYSLSSLCAFNLPGGRQMFAPLPLDRTTRLSLLFFLLLHLRVSSRHFLFPLARPFPLRTFCTLLCRPSIEDPSLPSSSSRIYWLTLTIKNSRADSTREKEREKAWNPSRMVICRGQKIAA